MRLYERYQPCEERKSFLFRTYLEVCFKMRVKTELIKEAHPCEIVSLL